MKTTGIWLFAATIAALMILPACKGGAPAQSAEDAADQISAHLDEGKTSEADDVYKAVKSSEKHRDVIYATLYQRAGNLYEESDFASASRLLGFLADHYPKSMAVKEALLWSLLLDRRGNKAGVPDKEQLAEMEELARDLRKSQKSPSPALELVTVQVEIDQGKLDAARKHLASFKRKWDGSPAELHAYMTELDRYLESHVGGAK